MEEYAREPCPYRIVDDCGGAFAMGCIGGGVFQAIKGFRNAPSGLSRRFVSNFVHCDAIAQSHELPMSSDQTTFASNLVLDWQFNIDQGTLTYNRWKLRCLGRNVLHN